MPDDPASDCEHHWVFIESLYLSESGGYSMHWMRFDRFFCDRCLQQHEPQTKDEWSRDRPTWWQSK